MRRSQGYVDIFSSDDDHLYSVSRHDLSVLIELDELLVFVNREARGIDLAWIRGPRDHYAIRRECG